MNRLKNTRNSHTASLVQEVLLHLTVCFLESKNKLLLRRVTEDKHDNRNDMTPREAAPKIMSKKVEKVQKGGGVPDSND